mgnify:CR=1 FL=1
MNLSIIIPVYNGAASLPDLMRRLDATLSAHPEPFEVILINDGSRDNSWDVIRDLSAQYDCLRGINLMRNYGQHNALLCGIRAARGGLIVTMDDDLQHPPEEIPRLLAKLAEGYDLVSGWKRRRFDSFVKRMTSRIFNRVTSALTGVKLHDINCGLKAYRREVTDTIRVYGQLHRFLPVLALKEGFRLGEIEVNHHPRKYGRSKFGVSRFTGGFFDLMTVLFLTRYTRRPLHFFGIAGLFAFVVGAAISIYLAYQRIFFAVYLSNRPLLFLGILLVIVGVQFISIGLIGEMIAATAEAGNPSQTYNVKKEVGFEK